MFLQFTVSQELVALFLIANLSILIPRTTFTVSSTTWWAELSLLKHSGTVLTIFSEVQFGPLAPDDRYRSYNSLSVSCSYSTIAKRRLPCSICNTELIDLQKWCPVIGFLSCQYPCVTRVLSQKQCQQKLNFSLKCYSPLMVRPNCC